MSAQPTNNLELHFSGSIFIREVCVLEVAEDDGPGGARLYGVVVPDMDQMRRRKIVNVGDLLRFELEGLSHALPPHQKLAGYEIVFDPLPRTATREFDRPEVERRVRERRLKRISDAPIAEPDRSWLAEPHAAAVVSLIQSHAKNGVRVWPDANLEIDLGLDSMERVELFSLLEQHFAAKLVAPSAIFTVRHLVDGLRGQEPAPGFAEEPWAAIFREGRAFEWLLGRGTLTGPLLWLLVRMARLLFVRVRVGGLSRLPPAGPFIITPNHQSYVDPFVLSSTLPYRVFKDLFIVGAPEYFETRFTRWVARTAKLVPVDPDSHLVSAMQAAAFGLTHNKILIVFPEGERSIDGTVKKFKKGAAVLARHLKVPVVPVAIAGTHEVWPRNGSINWRVLAPWSGHRVRIEIGEPVALDEGSPYNESAARLRERVSAMWALLSP